MVHDHQTGPEDQGVLVLPSPRGEAELYQGHQEGPGFRNLQDLQEGQWHRGVLGLPLVQGIRERQADRYLPSYQCHREDQRDLGSREHQHLPSVRGSLADQENRECPSLPSRLHFPRAHEDPLGQVHLLFQGVQGVLGVLWGPAEPVLGAQEDRCCLQDQGGRGNQHLL